MTRTTSAHVKRRRGQHARDVAEQARGSVRRPGTRVKQSLFGGYFSLRDAGLFAVLYVISVAHAATMTVVLLGIIPWTMMGVRQAYFAMSFICVLRFANTGFAKFSPWASILFYVIMIIGSMKLYASARNVTAPVILLLLFCMVACITSIQVSKVPDVSVMKAISLLIFVSALLLSSSSLSADDVDILLRWFFSLMCVVGILSIMTAPFPGIAYKLGGVGFQGIFSHPQQLGVMFAPFVAWSIARAFINRNIQPRPFEYVCLLVGIGLIVMSRARTAMLATFISVAIATIVHQFRSPQTSDRKGAGQIAGLIVASVLFISMAIALTGGVGGLVEEVVFKGSGTETVEDAFQQSRGAGVAEHLHNFADAPFTGHGFGVYRNGVMGGEANIVRVFGLPISAPAEKGFAFTAVLEEVGIIGASIFYILIFVLATKAARSPRPEVLAMLLGAILINFGEAVIFSPGGIGLFMWMIISIVVAAGRLDGKPQ